MIFTLFVFGIATQVFSQNNENSEKIQKIKQNPSQYVEEGGVLTDDEIQLPEKVASIITDDFIIHKNFKDLGSDESSLMTISNMTFVDIHLTRDQGSKEYITAKSNWIEKNKENYQQITTSSDSSEKRAIRNLKR